MKKYKWQHEETGAVVECSGQPTPRWHKIPECEHGISGCLMHGEHLESECFTEEMIKAQEAEVLQFPGITTCDIPCRQVIEGAAEKDFERLLIVGFTEDGELYCASHTSDIGALLLLMERAKHHLLHEVASE